MKNIVEILYEYLWNPKKKHHLLHIIEILKKDKWPDKHIETFEIILQEFQNDSNTNQQIDQS